MTEDHDGLLARAAQLGLHADWTDIWGKRHEVPAASLEALIIEFGAQAPDVDDGAAPRLLPPVIHACTDRELLRVPLGAPAPAAANWALTLENEPTPRYRARLDAGADMLEIAAALPPGYHRLALHGSETDTQEALLVCAPVRCWRPAALGEGVRLWGPAVQLYGVRSARNWGIGDFGDLLRLIEVFAGAGAGLLGVNPLHALFPHNALHVSPYSPSSRAMLNVLYLDVEAIADFSACDAARARVRAPDFQARLDALRAAAQVDYAGVAAAKFEILETLYAQFRTQHLDLRTESSARARNFRAFQAEGGKALRGHALFEALQAHFHRIDASAWGWPVWPEAYRDAQGEAARRFEAEHLDRVEYFEYLQWQAEQQLARAAARATALGMEVGLYLDLAVSVDRGGSDTWVWRECFAHATAVGAPPDEFNPNGQNWGLPPFRPDALRGARYAPFIAALRACMRDAGALRIDHVMGLLRLFCIPPGRGPAEGAYVRYRLEEMLALVVLESHRNRCMVIGEDLGTVSEEVRDALARAGVLSYKVLWFERDKANAFRAPADIAREALVTVSTHDLPTLSGWWEGHDLKLRDALNLFPNNALRDAQYVARAQDRARLLLALGRAKLLPVGIGANAPPATLVPALITAVHAYAAAAPSPLMMVQLEDLLGITEQPNLPGTVNEHPNWRRRLPVAVEALTTLPHPTALLARLAAERPHPKGTATPEAHAARIPRATCRLQLHSGFDFAAAARVVPYLAALGVSHVYTSPVLRARAGSTHGYDIVDHRTINPELGGREGFDRFSALLRRHGMGLILDIVPNHMGVLGGDNAWWLDVLENGPASDHAGAFDIDWHPVNDDLEGKVLLPVLGDHYGEVLARGEIALAFDAAGGGFSARYFEHRFPIDPRSCPAILERAAALFAADLPSGARLEFSSLAAAFGHLPSRDDPDPMRRAERLRDRTLHMERLARLAQANPRIGEAIDAALAEINAPPGETLHALLEAQAWRLAFWRVASDEINYRRFFDINDLAALRMEDEEVFEATHDLVLDLAAEGMVDGLRIDHPDGLFDPAQYFIRLQEGYARRAGIEPGPARDGRAPRPLYVTVEKITARHENLPEAWAVHGTTGYRFGMLSNGVFVDTAARSRIDRIWRGFTGIEESFEDLAYRGRHAIMRSALASELTVLASELLRIARADRRTRDFTFNTLRRALAEVAACMPVYRSYIVRRASAQDRRTIDQAVAHATERGRAADTSIFGYVRQALLGIAPEGAPRALAKRVLRFAMRFQQFSSPVTAKGVEDTAFYRFNRLVSLNEVGGDPDQFGISVRAWHGGNTGRAAAWPHTMLATSTHDNKRAEDVRLRINVISEQPAAWRLLLRRWREMSKGARAKLKDGRAPTRNDEYLLYQTLLGTFPAAGLQGEALAAYRRRIAAYLVKAARESKEHTSWISPGAEYESALEAFVETLLAGNGNNPFLEDLRQQVVPVEWFGALNSVSMMLLKYTAPGVPDLYQGCELIDLSLVDPDNRRPVDWALRERLLGEMRALPAGELAAAAAGFAATPADGRAKLLVIWRLLEFRRQHAVLLREGVYSALQATGSQAAHVIAYQRRLDDQVLVTLASRLHVKLLKRVATLPLGEAVWGDTTVALPGFAQGQRFDNVLTGETVTLRNGALRMSEAFANFPGAALTIRPPG